MSPQQPITERNDSFMKHDHISFQEYNMDKVKLPNHIEELIPPDSMAHVVHEVVERIPMETFRSYYKGGGRSAFHPKMMTKVVLYAYTQKIYHGRQIERELYVHLPLMWLSGFQKPDFRTINRFRSERMKGLIDDLFKEILVLLVDEGYVQLEDYFVDGTKIEANANRYSFHWKKSAIRYREKLKENVDQLIAQIDGIAQEEQACDEEEEELTERVESKVQEWEERLHHNPEQKELKKAVKKMKGNYLVRSKKYDEQLAVCGERNSYSKTDPDATFMRMKEDHMKNGQLKPGFNLQVGSNNQFVLGYSIHQRPGDTRCLIPHLEEVKKKFEVKPKRLIGDAGYGSEENYAYLKEQRIQGLVKYNTYEKEQKRSFQKQIHHQQNWTYDEEKDVFICAAGKQLKFEKEIHKKTESGYLSTVRKYRCQECKDCPFFGDCTTSKEGRSTEWNRTYQTYKKQVKRRLKTNQGTELYSKRKIDIESVFGHMKHNRAFRRFHLRGLQKISIEWGLLCVAHNLLKKAAIDRNQRKTG